MVKGQVMLNFEVESVGSFLKERIKKYEYVPKVFDYGVVKSSADDIIHVEGLPHSRYGELLEFGEETYGLALDLNENGVGAVLLGRSSVVVPGCIVKGTGHVADICVGDQLLGRVIDPIGRAIDGKELVSTETRPVECPAPTIMQRSSVNKPLETGLLAIDSMIPIGRGQRELIVGDRQTGKTAIALSAMINQRKDDVVCVYCAIGQKASTIAQIVHTLESAGALEHTVIVASTASDCSSLQYLTPYAGCSIAEKFMYDGRDVLIVYDDLSKHAVAYRAMSLLLRRPSGREAYPGDVFYLHSRLLERAAKLSPELGGGSMTALPIVETMAGDISSYIPTNIISITDGQIYLESELFNAGIRPAVNVGLSVSRVGRSAQHDAMKKVSGSLRLEVAQYRDTAVFAQFGADIDASTAQLLSKGEKLTELLKQRQDDVLKLSAQVCILLAYSNNLFNNIPVKQISECRKRLLEYMKLACDSTLSAIDSSGSLSDSDKDLLLHEMESFFKGEENEQRK